MLAIPTTPARDCAALIRNGRITQAVQLLATVEAPTVEHLALSLECRLARGEMELAIRDGDLLRDAADPDPLDAARIAYALGTLAAATGRDDDAVAHFRTSGSLADDVVALPWRAGAALSLVRTRARREATELATEQLDLARASGSAYAVADALRTVATCLMLDPADPLREARGLAVGWFDRLEAQIAADLAGVLSLRPGDDARCEAVTLLRAAEEYADAEDLWPLHTRVRRLLERLGETPCTARTEIIAQLTESELRVARLAALGNTNRAIAATVGVSVKAIEWHLSHTYRKLGVRGRGDLPRVLRLA